MNNSYFYNFRETSIRFVKDYTTDGFRLMISVFGFGRQKIVLSFVWEKPLKTFDGSSSLEFTWFLHFRVRGAYCVRAQPYIVLILLLVKDSFKALLQAR